MSTTGVVILPSILTQLLSRANLALLAEINKLTLLVLPIPSITGSISQGLYSEMKVARVVSFSNPIGSI